MILPGCDRCGQCGCVCGALPYTITVAFSGLVNQAHSKHCELVFKSNFGCGAAGVGMSPGGCAETNPECGPSDEGPLTEVLLTNGGHDYARTGRVQPTLTISGGGGTGATFTPTLAAVDGKLAEQCRSYKLSSVAVSGGKNYINGAALTIKHNGVQVTQAKAVVVTDTARVEPSVTAFVDGVDGESLSVTLESAGGSPDETWGVESVAVGTAGTGWSSTAWTLPVTFATTGIKVHDAEATATKQVLSPGAEYNYTAGGGTGFSGTVTLAEQTCNDGYPCWMPTSISITSGGSGFAVNDVLEFLAIGRDPETGEITGVANYTVTDVSGSGGVVSVSEPEVPEPFRKFTGGVGAITIDAPGAYYALGDGGVPTSVTINNAGEYYKEDPTAPVCLAEVEVSAANCGGTDAKIAATIGDDPANAETWGKITALTIDEGGDGYLCWQCICDTLDPINGHEFVLVAQSPKKLVTLEVTSDFGTGACLGVVPVAAGTVCDPPVTDVFDGGPSPIRQVEILNKGSGYARVVDGNVELATVTVGVAQLPPSNGSGADISVVVEDDPANANFGKIVSAAVGSGGSGYTLVGGSANCTYKNSDDCAHVDVTMDFPGNNKPPQITLATDAGVHVVLRGDDPVGDCNSLTASATLLYGEPSEVTASIGAGGIVAKECEPPEWCSPCCPLALITPETCVTITGTLPCGDGFASYTGPYKDAVFECPWTDPSTGQEYVAYMYPGLTCCACGCEETGPYACKVHGDIGGNWPIEDEPVSVNMTSGDGDPSVAECVTLEVTDGVITGSISVSDGTYSATIQFLGDC